MREYNHLKIEKKWQKEWDKNKVYKTATGSKKPKFYSLIEFPYPSGQGLHVGHPRPYIGMDIISRKRRMEGYNVLYPIGWDAFGLPTENYAIKTGKDPRFVTKENSDNFRHQIKSLSISFDWDREINTTDPKYYKWTQWIFLQFLKKGLAYKAKININWCPKDKIGLANEEVIDGKCERCGTGVEKREKEQWMLAITKYADRLDKDLDDVDYMEKIKTQQRNWIGKSEGSEIDFKVVVSSDASAKVPASQHHHSQKYTDSILIKVFTTRADTLFGATYMVLAPEHELVNKLKSEIQNWDEVEKYINQVKNKTEIERTSEDKEKTGIELKGIKAINPGNKEEIPVFIADYVLANYGTGAIMAVPAHDERDYAFAKKYDLPIKQVVGQVIRQTNGESAYRPDEPPIFREAIMCVVKHWSKDEYLVLQWKLDSKVRTFISGGTEGEDVVTAGKREILEESGYKNPVFKKQLGGHYFIEFWHQQKKLNRRADMQYLYFELANGEKEEISNEEKNLHDVLWKNKNELKDFLFLPEKDLVLYLMEKNENFYSGVGYLLNSREFDGLTSEEAREKITKAVGGKIVIKYKLRDWVFSRQRYWGEPIPVVHCEKCGIVPVPEKDLPIELPKVKKYQPTDSGESPLANVASWVNTKCPKCKGYAKRETDTMPNWAGSSWYYLRYVDPTNKKEFASKKNLKQWTPVDWYNGGMEHTTLHLLYSRFWHKFLYDLKLVPTKEPYKKRTSHGLILGKGGIKMSKSLGNVVNPNEIVKTFGADTLRLYTMFMGPFEEHVAWSEESIIGPRRFIEKVWKVASSGAFAQEYPASQRHHSQKHADSASKLTKLLHKTIKKVGEDIEAMRFNTAISSMMILATEMQNSKSVSLGDFKMFLQILSPFAPHVAEELWQTLGEKKSINLSPWPKYDEKLLKDDEVKIVIQINGKVRGEFMINADLSEDEVKAQALKEDSVIKHLGSTTPKRIIYVKNRLINIVI